MPRYFDYPGPNLRCTVVERHGHALLMTGVQRTQTRFNLDCPVPLRLFTSIVPETAQTTEIIVCKPIMKIIPQFIFNRQFLNQPALSKLHLGFGRTLHIVGYWKFSWSYKHSYRKRKALIYHLEGLSRTIDPASDH